MKSHRHSILHNVSIRELVVELNTRIRRNKEIAQKAIDKHVYVNVRYFPKQFDSDEMSDSMYCLEHYVVNKIDGNETLIISECPHPDNCWQTLYIPLNTIQGIELLKEEIV